MTPGRVAYFAARYLRLKTDPEWVAKRKAHDREYHKTHPKKRRQRGITPGQTELYRLRRKTRVEAAKNGIPVIDAYRFRDCLIERDLNP